MTAQQSQAPTLAGITPTALTPAATDTILEQYFGPTGCLALVNTTGTATNVSVLDPTKTDMGNTGTAPVTAVGATAWTAVLIPRSAIDPATGYASVTFSGARTGVTYYLFRV